MHYSCNNFIKLESTMSRCTASFDAKDLISKHSQQYLANEQTGSSPALLYSTALAPPANKTGLWHFYGGKAV